MSEHEPQLDDALEERIILELLEGDPLAALHPGTAGPGGAHPDIQETRARREYLELLGLLALGVEPVKPRPETKQRLLARLPAPAAAPAPGRHLQAVAPARADVPAAGPTEAVPPEIVPPEIVPPRRESLGPTSIPRSRRVSSGLLALAASLALVFAGLSVYLFTELRETREQVAELSVRVEQLAAAGVSQEQSGVLPASDEVGAGRAPLLALAETQRMLEDGAFLCKLWPAREAEGYGDARGLLVVAANHQHWSLQITGLEQPPGDQVFRVWFFTGEGVEPAGVLTLSPRGFATASSLEMPADTRAIAITLEPDATGAVPRGERILFGEEKMTLL